MGGQPLGLSVATRIWTQAHIVIIVLLIPDDSLSFFLLLLLALALGI